ncbi:MAG: flagellin [Deltaproteobacteria bacterium]|nr:flagellin [Deltaproteobacteria bacterium]
MGLRINSNVQAMNSHRQLLINDRALGKSLEKLSSGMKINRSADGPAAMMIAEQLRAQTAALSQAVDNSETAVTMIQTAEASLNEVTNLLINMRQLTIHAANEGANDKNMLAADQLEINQALNTIDRITNNSQFGTKKLLDGSTGANGVGIGEGVEFVEASTATRSSPIEGYELRVTQLGTKAKMTGTVALNQEMIDNKEEFTIAQGGKTVSFVATPGDTVEQVYGKLNAEVQRNGLDVVLERKDDGRFTITHKEYGSEHTFSASSKTAGVLSVEAGQMEAPVAGKDIKGKIGGEIAIGKGVVLTGAEGTRVEGLKVRYTGEVTSETAEEGPIAGKVAVYQNSLIFQVGPNVGQTESISLINTNSRVLGRGVENESRFESLREVDVTTPQGAQDAQKLIEVSMDQINRTRSIMGAFQKNTLESNLRQLRINTEELTNAASVIKDADMAKEVADFTRNSIMTQSATAMLAQANQSPQTVLALLG